MLWTFAQVALGGAVGSVARFGVFTLARGLGFAAPAGTLTVNVLGSFVMGLLFVYLSERDLLRHAPLLMAGVLGGFTTFSAFSLDVMVLWERGAVAAALGYGLASVLMSVGGLWAGMVLMRGWLA